MADFQDIDDAPGSERVMKIAVKELRLIRIALERQVELAEKMINPPRPPPPPPVRPSPDRDDNS